MRRSPCLHGVQVDAEHVVSFKRTILDFRIDRLAGHDWAGRSVAAVHITGSAFLWHQVLTSSKSLGRGVDAVTGTALNPRLSGDDKIEP